LTNATRAKLDNIGEKPNDQALEGATSLKINLASEACVRAMRAFVTTLFSVALLQGAPVLAEASKRAPPAVQAEFAGFMGKFVAALKADDAAAVAAMAKLPFQGDAGVSDAAQFRAKIYKARFSPKARACLQRGAAVYDRDQENNDNFNIFCGQVIFIFTKTPAGFLLTDIGEND
jgi:hypothetical protein